MLKAQDAMDIEQLTQEFETYQRDATLFEEFNLMARAKALALIELLQRLAQLRQPQPGLAALLPRATALQQQIEQVNESLFQRLRQAIQQGHWRGERFATVFHQFIDPVDLTPTALYFQADGLDLLITGLLRLHYGPTTNQRLTAGMVHYERTPARAILALVTRVDFTTQPVFYDLGSGLGEVPILVHLLTGTQTRGVEIESDFCRYAQQQIEVLNLPAVQLINADARTVDYREGEVFFMFTPFYGAVLQQVLDRLHQQAHHRPITLCTYGPCTPVVAQQPWLALTANSINHEFALTIFRST